MDRCSRVNRGFRAACHVVRTLVNVESECADPFVITRSALNMILHMNQRVLGLCDYRHGCSHGSCSGGHFIHCLNAVFAVFGKMSRLATDETLSIFLVGVFSQNLNVFGLLAVSFAFAFPLGCPLPLSLLPLPFHFLFLCRGLWAGLCFLLTAPMSMSAGPPESHDFFERT